MNVEDRQQNIAIMRILRAGLASLGVLYVGMSFWDLLRWHMPFLGVTMACMTLTMVGTVTFATQVIRRRRAELRRPDHAAIARMEREIWGRTFEHARWNG